MAALRYVGSPKRVLPPSPVTVAGPLRIFTAFHNRNLGFALTIAGPDAMVKLAWGSARA